MDHVSGSPVVVLQDKAHERALPIWIGPAEAQAIAVQMEGIQLPRPMTHDLMKSILEQAGVEVRRVVIQELRQSTYHATIHLQSGRQTIAIDSRPSDAIALAVRCKTPIFVARPLLSRETAIDLRQIAGAATASARGVTVQALSGGLAEHFGLPDGKGVLVSGVASAIPDVQKGDVILAVNDEAVTGVTDFSAKVHELGAAPAQLTIQRGEQQVRVALVADAR
jgi:hypothetical protein